MLANTSREIVLDMLFLAFSNTSVKFVEQSKKLIWRFYTIIEVLSITCRVLIINKREFAKTPLNRNSETFVIQISILKAIVVSIYPFRVAQIAVLYWDKSSTEVPLKYSYYTDVFSFDLTIESSKNTSINKYIIKLVKDEQLLYDPIYALNLVKLEILKAYIKTHL